jgi:hypothetical protein
MTLTWRSAVVDGDGRIHIRSRYYEVLSPFIVVFGIGVTNGIFESVNGLAARLLAIATLLTPLALLSSRLWRIALIECGEGLLVPNEEATLATWRERNAHVHASARNINLRGARCVGDAT